MISMSLIQVPLRFLLAFFPETCGRFASFGWGCIPLRSLHLQRVPLLRPCSLTQGRVCLPEPCWILHSLAGKPVVRHQKPAAGSGRLRGLRERGPRETIWDLSEIKTTPILERSTEGISSRRVRRTGAGLCSFRTKLEKSSLDAMGRYCEHLIKGETQVELPQTPAQAMPFLASVGCAGGPFLVLDF